MRLRKKQIFPVMLFISVLLLAEIFIFSFRSQSTIEQGEPSFIFTAVGDYGANKFTAKNLKNIKKLRPDVHLALGDFSYNEIAPETKWCAFVKKYLKNTPIALLAGNHESNGKDGSLDNFLSCLPNTLSGIEGEYGKEYFFDYPEDDPLARFILISPDLRFSDGKIFVYKSDSGNFKWLKKVAKESQGKDIPWTVVAMHKTCLSAGDKSCEVGEELINYLLANNIDLILQGHAHSYQRTKQLTCIKVNAFDSSCVGEDELSGYKQGNGAVISIIGTGGAPSRKIDYNDPEVSYFASLEGDIYGFMKFEVKRESLKGAFHSTSGVKDEFTIKR